VRVADYYERERKAFKACKLPDGSIVRADAVPEGVEPVETRDSYEIVVKIYKTNGVEILERSDWVESHIPVVPFYGETLLIDGKLTHSGLVRAAKDPAMLFNFMKTAQAEAIALTPKAPYIGPFAAKAGFEKEWSLANRKNQDYLPFNHVDEQGNPIPSPQRQFAQADIGAITQAMQGCEDDLKASIGMYDANLGNREGSQSGVAIRSLAAQGQTGNFHYQDNFNRSLRHAGRILINAEPKVYDNPRVLRIIKEDDAHEMVGVNGATAENQEQTFDLTQGRFDVIVTAGPSYASKRAENLAVMMDLAKVIPGFAEIGGDLMVSQMDTPIARQIQERLKMSLPPQFQDKKGQPELPPEIQQQMQQYGQTIDQMTEALNKAHDQLDQKTLELENRKEIALIQQKTELIKALAQIEGKAAHTMLEAEIAAAQAMIGQDQPIMEGQGQMQAPEPIEEVPALDESQEMPEEPMEPEEVMPPEPTAEEIQSAAILEAMNNQSMALGAVAQALEKLSAPKRLITDKMGRPIGVESVNG